MPSWTDVELFRSRMRMRSRPMGHECFVDDSMDADVSMARDRRRKVPKSSSLYLRHEMPDREGSSFRGFKESVGQTESRISCDPMHYQQQCRMELVNDCCKPGPGGAQSSFDADQSPELFEAQSMDFTMNGMATSPTIVSAQFVRSSGDMHPAFGAHQPSSLIRHESSLWRRRFGEHPAPRKSPKLGRMALWDAAASEENNGASSALPASWF